MFKFSDYHFDEAKHSAEFSYVGPTGIKYTEKIQFAKPLSKSYDPLLLNRALFLASMLIGTSYYKSHPTTTANLDTPIDDFQANFFNHVYQDGLSQYAFENQLTRADLVIFQETAPSKKLISKPEYSIGKNPLVLQSGGKDSLLNASMITGDWTALYIGSSENYPDILNHLGAKKLQIITRTIDHRGLEEAQKSGGKNGHVPVTYINLAVALIQAILNGQTTILSSIGHEGEEAHATIGDLPVNHQWSKTWTAEQLLQNYITNYIGEDFIVGSPLRQYSELKIAELFAKNCWEKYGHSFSSCNVANYKQGDDNSELKWCGRCAKCANSYLLFAPFLSPEELKSIFSDQDLFEIEDLRDEFKGLLGIDDHMKPFECIGEVDELRTAYAMKQSGYADLPFDIPNSNYNYHHVFPHNLSHQSDII